MSRICALLALGAMLAGQTPAQEVGEGPAAFWRRELAAHRSLGAGVPRGTTRSSLGTRRLPEPPAVIASPAPESASRQAAPTIAERVNALRTKIQHTEARLLYATTSEERALAYNAERRNELRALGSSLERGAAEREALLRELAAEHRELDTPSQRESWMRSHRSLVLSELQALVDARRRRTAVDGGLQEIDATDERLRRLIEKKQGDQRRHATAREELLQDEPLRVELPVAAVAEPEHELGPEELRLLRELFPAR